MSPTTSRKTLAPPGRRAIQIRLNPDEAKQIDDERALAGAASGVQIKPGAYAKAALLGHYRLHELVKSLRASLHHNKVPPATLAKLIDETMARISEVKS